MKRLLNLLMGMALFPNLYAQVPCNKYLFSTEIEEKLQSNTSTRQLQHLAVDFSFIGAYKKVLEMDERFVLAHEALKKKKTKVSADFSMYQAVDALIEIEKRAKEHSIVIINEAHYSAQNRLFTSQLLERLYAQGYQTVFLEGLHDEDKNSLKKRTYPLISAGTYFREAQYGNLFRRAVAKGYAVLPYDQQEDTAEADPLKRWYSREEGQADCILRYLKVHPSAKIIIHCGYGHLNETIHEGDIIGNLGAIIKQKSGINPLTINQEEWLETHSNKTANPYRLLIEEQRIKSISVFKNREGELFSTNPTGYDMNVYFPPTTYVIGRPMWLFTLSEKRGVAVPYHQINATFPYLLFAYKEGDDSEATPVDVLEIKSSMDRKILALEKGRYQLLVKSLDGQVQRLPLEVN
ncbi:MAG: hypothetical protein ACRBFS_21805 [Aureispira sp.]